MQLDIPDLSFDFHCLSLHLTCTYLKQLPNLNPRKYIFLWESTLVFVLSVDFKKLVSLYKHIFVC